MTSPKDPSGLFEDADIIFTYTDRQAVEDGILVPLRAAGRDTGHRITASALAELRKVYPKPGDEQLGAFVLCELLPLIPEARRVYEQNIGGGILKTDYRFAVTSRSDDVLWYVPNEVGGITLMKPEDY